MDAPPQYRVTFVDIDILPGSPLRQWVEVRAARPAVGDLVMRPEVDDKRRFVRSVYATADGGPCDVTAAVSREHDSLFTFKRFGHEFPE